MCWFRWKFLVTYYWKWLCRECGLFAICPPVGAPSVPGSLPGSLVSLNVQSLCALDTNDSFLPEPCRVYTLFFICPILLEGSYNFATCKRNRNVKLLTPATKLLQYHAYTVAQTEAPSSYCSSHCLLSGPVVLLWKLHIKPDRGQNLLASCLGKQKCVNSCTVGWEETPALSNVVAQLLELLSDASTIDCNAFVVMSTIRYYVYDLLMEHVKQKHNYRRQHWKHVCLSMTADVLQSLSHRGWDSTSVSPFPVLSGTVAQQLNWSFSETVRMVSSSLWHTAVTVQLQERDVLYCISSLAWSHQDAWIYCTAIYEGLQRDRLRTVAQAPSKTLNKQPCYSIITIQYNLQ